MIRSIISKKGRAVVISWLVLAAASALSASADAPIWELQVKGCQVSGNQVLVSVGNPNAVSASGTLRVEAIVGTMPIWGSQVVTLDAGKTAVVPVSFPGPVQDIIEARVE